MVSSASGFTKGYAATGRRNYGYADRSAFGRDDRRRQSVFVVKKVRVSFVFSLTLLGVQG